MAQEMLQSYSTTSMKVAATALACGFQLREITVQAGWGVFTFDPEAEQCSDFFHLGGELPAKRVLESYLYLQAKLRKFRTTQGNPRTP